MAKKWPERVVKWPTHRFVCFFMHKTIGKLKRKSEYIIIFLWFFTLCSVLIFVTYVCSAELQMNELIVCLWPKSQQNSKYLSEFYIFCLYLLKLCNLFESNQMHLRADLPESHLKVTWESFESHLNDLWESHESSESRCESQFLLPCHNS